MVADWLIAADGQMIQRAHARGMKAFGATITPFGTSFTTRPSARPPDRRSTPGSAPLDISTLLSTWTPPCATPPAPTRLAAQADSGDHLQLNDTGYRMAGRRGECGNSSLTNRAKRI